jgi:hypothetical protein
MVSVIKYLLIKIETKIIQGIGKMPGVEEFTSEFFDQSSEAWMKNKLRKGASMAYICIALTKEGNSCKRTAIMNDALSEHYCKQHRNYGINKIIKDE